MPFPKKGTPEYEAWKNSPQYEELREKHRRRAKHRWQNEEYQERQRESRKQIHQSKECREKKRQVMLKVWQNEEYRKKHREKLRQAHHSEESREKKRQAMLEVWRDEEYRKKHQAEVCQACQSQEFKEKMRQVLRHLWQDPEYAQRVLTSLHQQTQPERQIEHLLDRLFPGEYQYVGLGEVIIGGKIPDFININGQKKIIEVYGDYWHQNDDPQERIDFFHRYGFDCLVIWESELQEVDSVVEKLVEFHSV